MDKANDLLSDVNTYDKLTSNRLKNKTFSLITPKLPYFYSLPKTTK